jgi:hypothetical protein
LPVLQIARFVPAPADCSQFAGVQVGHHWRAQRRGAVDAVQNAQRPRAVANRQASGQRGREKRVLPAQERLERRRVAFRDVAARQHRAGRPGRAAAQPWHDAIHRLLGQLAVGGELAAEHRQHRRARLVQRQTIIARHAGGVVRRVVQQRAHAGKVPHHLRRADRAGQIAVHRLAEVVDLRR